MTQTIAQKEPGIFTISSESFTATVDAETYDPDVRVSYTRGFGQIKVYSRQDGEVVVNGDRNVSLDGEQDAIRALFAAADGYVRPRCSCYSVQS